MARPIKRFVCQSCGAVTSKWSGRCESCGEWNTIVEESAPAPGPAGGGLARAGKGRKLDFGGLTGSTPQPPRYQSGIVEFAKKLAELRIEILSTGGTSKLLREAGLIVRAADAGDP